MSATIRFRVRKGKNKKKKNTFIFALNKCPQKKGVIIRIRIDTPRKPNSAKRTVAWLKLSNNRKILGRIRGSGHNLQAFSNVLVTRGRANDVPGVRYLLIKGKYDFNWSENIVRSKKRSKYGIPKNTYGYY